MCSSGSADAGFGMFSVRTGTFTSCRKYMLLVPGVSRRAPRNSSTAYAETPRRSQAPDSARSASIA